MSTAGTDDPADAEPQKSFRCFHGAVIITVDGKAAGMSAGTDQSVELEGGNKIIIKSWSHGIVFFDK